MAITRSSPPRRVAADTSALLALASSRDQYHARARATAERLRASGTRLLGHALIIGELHGHLLHRLDAQRARAVVNALLDDSAFEWADATTDLVRRAITGWIERYRDQRFSLTDAVTFELMRETRITHAFAFDQDFIVAGFKLL